MNEQENIASIRRLYADFTDGNVAGVHSQFYGDTAAEAAAFE